MPELKHVPIDAITIDGGTQSRESLDLPSIEKYTQDIRDGATMPPVDLYYDGQTYWPGDGHQRIVAHANAGKSEIAAYVRSGSKHDAMLHSAGANDTHGLRRSEADKVKSLRMLLDDGHWADKRPNWFATQCRVSFHLADKVYREWHVERSKPCAPKQVRDKGENRNTKGDDVRTTNPNSPEKETRGESLHLDEDQPPVDGLGRDVPNHLRDAFRAARDARGIINELGVLANRSREFARTPGGRWLNLDDTLRCISQAQLNLKFACYHTECPDCLAREAIAADCKVCKGAGFIPKDVFSRLSDKQKDALSGKVPF